MTEAQKQPGHDIDGGAFLTKLGFGEFADKPITITEEGREIEVPAREFTRGCGERAVRLIVGLNAMDPAHPDYEPMLDYARQHVAQELKIPQE